MKKSIIPVAAFIAGMAIVPSVFALEGDITPEFKNWQALAQSCLNSDQFETCSAEDVEGQFEVVADTDGITIEGNKTLDLAGKTLNVTNASDAGLLHVPAKTTLTIKNGTIESAASYGTIVADGGTIVLDNVTIKGVNPVFVRKGGSNVTVNANTTLEGVNGSAFAIGADVDKATVTINGELKSTGASAVAYKQEGKATATISGIVTAEDTSAILISAGVLNLDHATVSSAQAAISAYGGKVNVKNCSTITGEGFVLYTNGNMEELTVKNSTLEATDGPVFDGKADTSIANVAIEGSYLKAADDAKVKTNNVKFTKHSYDGNDKTELSAIEGAYGTLAAVCGDTTADEGEDKGDNAENPNTADTIATYITIATVALLGLGATAFVAKKSNR